MHQLTFVILMLMRLVEGTDYLVALPHASFETGEPYVRARTDETGGTLIYEDPNFEWRRYADISPWETGQMYFHPRIGTFRKIEYNAIPIESSNSVASVKVLSKYISFAPLPTSALGTKYIVSACRQSGHSSLLLIASYNLRTTVSIKARSHIFGPSLKRENKQIFKLKPFQTFTYESYYYDLTGTVITSTHPVAVFSGMVSSSFLTTYEQLLPVRLYGKEYLVAVDDNPALYHLQIISEQNGTVITFNNGSSVTVNSTLYKAQLTSLEKFYFHASNPVMVTICRRNGTQSGFVVIPPVSLYSMRVVYLHGGSIFMTQKETFVNSSDISWTRISNSGYKIGVLAKGSKNTKAHGCNLVFSSSSIWTDGVTFPQDNRIEQKKSYLVAVLDHINSQHGYTNQVNLQLSSSQAASYQVVVPRRNQTKPHKMTAMSSDNFYIENEMIVQTGVENKAIRVDVDVKESQLIIKGSTYFRYNSWLSSIFPTNLLGQKYIVQACYGNRPSEFKLIIVSSSMNTVINVLLSHSITYGRVEYKPGDTIRVGLQPYQTLTINSSVALCGTFVSASHNVAVFAYNKLGELTPDYDQLLPVEEFGQEYIVTTSDQGNVEYNRRFGRAISESSKYYLLVVSATNLTQVQFSDNLLVTLAQGVSYHKELHKNESLHLSSTEPVMVSLCLDASAVFYRGSVNQSRCTVIIPTSLYTTESRFFVKTSTIIKLLTEFIDAEITVMLSDQSFFNVSVGITWETYTEFKIGTTTVDDGEIFISSTDKFTTICFNRNDEYNYFSYDSPFGDIVNPMGWNPDKGSPKDHYVSTTVSQISEAGGKSGDVPTEDGSDISPANDVSSQDGHVNIAAVAVGTSLSVLNLVLLAVIIYQQISKRRNTRLKGENAAPFKQSQQQHRRGVAAVSTPAAIYSDLHTGPQATNTYESINPSFAADEEVEYENVESKF